MDNEKPSLWIKILYFAPPVALTLLLSFLTFWMRSFLWLWYLWVAVLWISGILLYKNKVWGSVPAMLLGINIIMMGVEKLINDSFYHSRAEIPTGAAMLIYYIICGICAWTLKGKTERMKRNID